MTFWGKKEGLVEGTSFERMKAIESWALSAYQESKKDQPDIDEIKENLRKINLQVKNLGSHKMLDEIRLKKRDPPKGFSPSIFAEQKELIIPSDMNDPRFITSRLTEIRAAAVVTLRDIKKNKTLSNGSKRNIQMLASLATMIIKEWTRLMKRRYPFPAGSLH